MNIWISGELQHDIADGFREARKLVEGSLNAVFRQKDYGIGLRDWTYIAMIYEDPGPSYKEVRRYKPSDKSCEFRSRIDHSRFKSEETAGRAGLLCKALVDCVRCLDTMRIDQLNTAQIILDCLAVARANGWRLPASAALDAGHQIGEGTLPELEGPKKSGQETGSG